MYNTDNNSYYDYFSVSAINYNHYNDNINYITLTRGEEVHMGVDFSEKICGSTSSNLSG